MENENEALLCRRRCTEGAQNHHMEPGAAERLLTTELIMEERRGVAGVCCGAEDWMVVGRQLVVQGGVKRGGGKVSLLNKTHAINQLSVRKCSYVGVRLNESWEFVNSYGKVVSSHRSQTMSFDV